MSKNGPLMYRVKPLYDSHPNLILPTCMYKMNNVFGNEKSTCVSNNEMECVKQEDLKLNELEKHQLSIIQKLEDLKDKVIKLKEDMGVKTENHITAFQDIVIKANPLNPPLSVWVFHKLLSQAVITKLATHVHSSLKDVPSNIKLLPVFLTDDQCNIALTIIWRDGLSDHEMMVSPINQGPVVGEVNIARYISRLISFNYEVDPVTSTLIDDWLEVAHHSVIHGNNKDRQGALRNLNSHLGKSSFLVGESLTIADIVIWSSLIQTKLHQSLSPNVAKWFKSLSNCDIFQQLNDFVLM